jgi:hypothetical protein
MGVGGQGHALAALPPGKIPGTHCAGGWVSLGPGPDGGENLAPIGVRAPNREDRGESLCRLRYTASRVYVNILYYTGRSFVVERTISFRRVTDDAVCTAVLSPPLSHVNKNL